MKSPYELREIARLIEREYYVLVESKALEAWQEGYIEYAHSYAAAEDSPDPPAVAEPVFPAENPRFIEMIVESLRDAADIAEEIARLLS